MSAVASDAVLYSSSAHRAGSSAHRGKDTNERAESSPFSEHLDSVREARNHESRSETSANRQSSKRDQPAERTATPSSTERTRADRAKPDRNRSADDDQTGAPAQAGDEAEPAPSIVGKDAANDAAAKADSDPANLDNADKVTINAITPADVDETPIDPAIGKTVTADPAALAVAAAQALDAADADTAETGQSAKPEDEKKADTKTDTSAAAKTTAPATMIQIVVAPADGAPPPPADDAQPEKAEGGKAIPIDLHPAVMAKTMSLKTDVDKADTGKAAADTSAEDTAAVQQAKTADVDQPDNDAPSNAKAAVTAPIHRQTTTDHNDISAIKPTVDADSPGHSAQNSGGANPTPPVNTGTPAHQAGLTSQVTTTNPTPAQIPSQPVPVAGLGIALAAKAMEGKNRFEIRLDPPELGKIEVRLEVHHNGEVTSRMIADRPDTLDLLRRDAAGLERALQDAGLKTSGNGLQFSLRDQGFTGHDQAPDRANTAHIVINDEIQSVSELPQRNYRPLTGLRGGLDIRV